MPNRQGNFEAQLILNLDQKLFANPRRMGLLAAIAEVGSLSQGAKQVGMSYKAAWDAINDMNQRAEAPLLLLAAGGKGGGGAELTAMGERLLQLYNMLEQIQQRAVAALQDTKVPLESLLGAVSQFSLQSSARNQYLGQVTKLTSHAGIVEAWVTLAEGTRVVAAITEASSARLSLQPGREVMVLVKAPAVQLAAPQEPQEIQLNRYPAQVAQVDGQDLMLTLAQGETLYCRSADLALVVGSRVTVTIDPDQVMLATLTP